jgi:hypothetical protein
MLKYGANLTQIVHISEKIKHVSKDNLNLWDWLLVNTGNSSYTIKKVGSDLYEISGGWFDKNGLSPSKVTIRGCTWGGSIIHVNMLAACGLSMEFSNNVITSPVKQVILIRAESLN